MATMACSLSLVKGLDSIACSLVAVSNTTTGESDLGDVTVWRTTCTSSKFGLPVIAHISLMTTKRATFFVFAYLTDVISGRAPGRRPPWKKKDATHIAIHENNFRKECGQNSRSGCKTVLVFLALRCIHCSSKTSTMSGDCFCIGRECAKLRLWMWFSNDSGTMDFKIWFGSAPVLKRNRARSWLLWLITMVLLLYVSLRMRCQPSYRRRFSQWRIPRPMARVTKHCLNS